MTRLSCWSPALRDDRPDLTRAGDFALSVGIPSDLSPPPPPEDRAAGWAAVDYALTVSVHHESQLPRGPLYLDGVPLVIRITRPRSVAPLETQVPAALAEPHKLARSQGDRPPDAPGRADQSLRIRSGPRRTHQPSLQRGDAGVPRVASHQERAITARLLVAAMTRERTREDAVRSVAALPP